MEPEVVVKRDGPIGTVTINNPARRNAMADSMWPALQQAMEAMEADQAVRVCILRGAGDVAFVSGADIARFEDRRGEAEAQAAHARRTAACWGALDAFSKPLIAMIQGFCLGAGMGIAAKADLRIAATGSVFGIPAGRLGIAYSDHLVRDIVLLGGPSVAKRMLFTAERLDAEEAHRLGVIDLICAPDELETRTQRLAETMAANAPLSLRAAKAAIGHFTTGAPDSVTLARNAEVCLASADHAEGVTAFLQKRSPVFQGR